MTKETVAILGGRGMLGTDLVEICHKQGYHVEIYDLPEFDITNSGDLKHALSDTQLVVNCAAYTDVDGAEKKTKLAYEVNAKAVGRLGAFAKKANLWLLYIITDFYF